MLDDYKTCPTEKNVAAYKKKTDQANQAINSVDLRGKCRQRGDRQLIVNNGTGFILKNRTPKKQMFCIRKYGTYFVQPINGKVIQNVKCNYRKYPRIEAPGVEGRLVCKPIPRLLFEARRLWPGFQTIRGFTVSWYHD